jgi:multiple sugar transport system substrate-binding protein/putative chitobiose transport system substrate-binding protein
MLASACVGGGGSSDDTGDNSNTSGGGGNPTSGSSTGAGSSGGSGGSSAPAKLSGSVEFWTINLKKNYNDYITGLINGFKTMQPNVTINWVDVPGADIATKFLAALAAKKLPDAVNIDSSNLGTFTTSFTDLSQYFSADDLADYEPGLLDTLKYDGVLRAVPWYNGGPLVGIYNMTVMGKVGFSPDSPPTSYDDALTLAQKVYDTTKVYGINDIPSPMVFRYYGIDMLSSDGKKAAFNTSAAADVLTKFKTAYDGHAIAPGAITNDTRNPPQSLDQNNLAFTPNAQPFQLLNYEKNSPNIYKELGAAKALLSHDGKVLLAGMQTFGIPAQSKNKDAAAAFIKYITNGANQLAFCKIVNIFPSTISSSKDPYFTNPSGSSLAADALKIAVSELPIESVWELQTTQSAPLGTAFQTAMQGFLQGQKNAKDTLSDLEGKWNSILAGGH